ncbi:ATP-dependent helicase, partial [Streptomyces sp. H39-C1]|nr:ATP-dependent helicase [Streptomyces sp. H39-C1]
MNRTTRSNSPYSRSSRTGGSGSGGSYSSRSAGSGNNTAGFTGRSRSQSPNRSGGSGRRPAALQGEFALPVTITPALPAVTTFGALDMPVEVLKMLTSLGMNEP